MDSDQPDKPQPKTEAAGNGNKPPRRTAVGAGGSGDDWDGNIGDLRGYDLDSDIDDELTSWPMPGLSFVQILSHGSQDKENDHMEETLSSLYCQRANLAFLYLGDNTRIRWFMGLSLPTASIATDDESISNSRLRSVLQASCDQIQLSEERLSAETIKTMIKPVSTYVGCITGIPATPGAGSDAMYYTQQIERLTVGLHGKEFGVLVVAIPVPQTMIHREDYSVLDLIERAREIKDPNCKRRVKYYLLLHEAYQRHLELGAKIGVWQVGVYYFASDRSVFLRLQSLIRAVYIDETNETSRPTPLRLHEINGLGSHLEQFGLLRNRRESFQNLRTYRYLTPLNSRVLSAYVNVPPSSSSCNSCS